MRLWDADSDPASGKLRLLVQESSTLQVTPALFKTTRFNAAESRPWTGCSPPGRRGLCGLAAPGDRSGERHIQPVSHRGYRERRQAQRATARQGDLLRRPQGRRTPAECLLRQAGPRRERRKGERSCYRAGKRADPSVSFGATPDTRRLSSQRCFRRRSRRRRPESGRHPTARRGHGKAVLGPPLALDIDPRHRGYEMWGKGSGVEGLFNAKGTKIAEIASATVWRRRHAR